MVKDHNMNLLDIDMDIIDQVAQTEYCFAVANGKVWPMKYNLLFLYLVRIFLVLFSSLLILFFFFFFRLFSFSLSFYPFLFYQLSFFSLLFSIFFNTTCLFFRTKKFWPLIFPIHLMIVIVRLVLNYNLAESCQIKSNQMTYIRSVNSIGFR